MKFTKEQRNEIYLIIASRTLPSPAISLNFYDVITEIVNLIENVLNEN